MPAVLGQNANIDPDNLALTIEQGTAGASLGQGRAMLDQTKADLIGWPSHDR